MQSKTYKFKTTLKNALGLHARPASIFVESAKKFKSNITIKKDGKQANAKSIIEVLSLGVEKGDEIEIICEGDDAKQASEYIKDLIENLSKLEE